MSAASSAAAATSLSATLSVIPLISSVCSTVFPYAAFLSGTAFINKNLANLHKKSDIRDAEAMVYRAKAELCDAKAELDRAKAELRDPEAKLDRTEAAGIMTTISDNIKKFEDGVEQAQTSFDDLSKAFGRESGVDPNNEKNDISSKAKLASDIAIARRKLSDLQPAKQGNYTPPQHPEGVV
jgi:hypothetical protein